MKGWWGLLGGEDGLGSTVEVKLVRTKTRLDQERKLSIQHGTTTTTVTDTATQHFRS